MISSVVNGTDYRGEIRCVKYSGTTLDELPIHAYTERVGSRISLGKEGA